MSDPFAKMTPGQPLGSGIGPFNLEWHNAVSDLVRHSIRHKSAGLNQGNIEVLEDTKIWIANVEGVIIPQFTAIGINKLLTFPDDFSDFRNRMCFVTAPLVRNRPFAITQKSIHVNQVFIAKSAIAAGGVQPPAGAWSRLIGDADPFDATAHYAIGEQVTYGGETYAAILPVDGQATSDTTYWIPLGSRRGLWDGDSYAAGEIVAVPSLGEILISGISRLLLFISHPRHLYAGVSELGISTQEEPGPLEIIWKEDGTGERWAIVRFCCDAFGLQVCAGVGALVFGPLELSASGIRYGGDFTAGVATLAGSGTSTPPGYTGDGAGSLPALTLTGSGNVYDPTPSGNLYFGVTALAGTGTVVNPPSGFAFIQFGVLALDGTGTNTPPTCTGTGALTFGAIVAVGVGGGCCGITSINGQTGPAVRLGLGRSGTGPNIGTITAWSSSVAYQAGDVVSLGGSNYYCILLNTNQTPPNATYWTLTTEDLIVANLPDASLTDRGLITADYQVITGHKIIQGEDFDSLLTVKSLESGTGYETFIHYLSYAILATMPSPRSPSTDDPCGGNVFFTNAKTSINHNDSISWSDGGSVAIDLIPPSGEFGVGSSNTYLVLSGIRYDKTGLASPFAGGDRPQYVVVDSTTHPGVTKYGQWATVAGLVFSGGIYTSGSFTGLTSVAVSGGTTGLTTSGGPITGSGTITIDGTLGVANGGTGATSLTSGSLIVGAGTGSLSAVTNTRVSSGNLQLKLAANSWVDFGEASY